MLIPPLSFSGASTCRHEEVVVVDVTVLAAIELVVVEVTVNPWTSVMDTTAISISAAAISAELFRRDIMIDDGEEKV